MVTFVCSYCDATLKKKQTEKHAFGSCRPPSFICIDCHKTFKGNDYKAHTSCLTQYEKHWGQYAKDKQKTANNSQQKPATPPVSNASQKQLNNAENKITSKQDDKKEEDHWKGWKNEIKHVIKEKGSEIVLQDLEKQVLKRYKKFEPDEDLGETELSQVFGDKLRKIKKVKLTTYVTLE